MAAAIRSGQVLVLRSCRNQMIGLVIGFYTSETATGITFKLVWQCAPAIPWSLPTRMR